MSVKLKAIPLSRARTMWGLCLDVKRRILEEPKRIDMNIDSEHRMPDAGGPACGSVGCFNGWIGFASGHWGKWGAAYKLLGSDVKTDIIKVKGSYSEGGSYLDTVFNSGDGDACATTKPDTRARARAVARRIDKFMRINEKALKARKLVVRDGKLEPVEA